MILSLILSVFLHTGSITPKDTFIESPASLLQAATSTLPIKVISIDDLIHQTVIKYGLNYQHFYGTLSCESEGFKDVSIQSQVPDPSSPDGYEQSYGISQINLPSHPDISYASATDPSFAINYAGELFASGQETQLHCYKILKARDWQ